MNDDIMVSVRTGSERTMKDGKTFGKWCLFNRDLD